MRPAGAFLVVPFAALVAFLVSWGTEHMPWAKDYITPSNVAFLLFAVIMVAVNLLTTLRGFKYGAQVQTVLNVIGKQFGIQVSEDGVVASVTAQQAEKLANVLTVRAAEPHKVAQAKLDAEIRRDLGTPLIVKSKPAPGLHKGGVCLQLIALPVTMPIAIVCLLAAAAFFPFSKDSCNTCLWAALHVICLGDMTK